MTPVTREMERLGWIYNPSMRWYQKVGTQLAVTHKEIQNAFDKGLLNEYLEEIEKAYKKKVRNKR